MGALHSFSIKNSFYDKIDLKDFLFSCNILICFTLESEQIFTNSNGHSTAKHSIMQTLE